MNLLRYLIIIFLCLIGTSIAFSKGYEFDPKDKHHMLYVPEGNGPFPAILLLHASTGVEKITQDWAFLLQKQGYVVFLIDSFTPRGYRDRSTVGWDKATESQFADILPARHYLATLSFVDKNRIGLMGFSMGGYSVLRAMTEKDTQLAFQAAISFYGVCKRLPANAYLQGLTLLLIGEKDDRSTTKDCEVLIERSKKQDAPVIMKTYANALHGFDNPDFPVSKEVVDESGEHYHVGYNEAARLASIKDLFAFLDQGIGAG